MRTTTTIWKDALACPTIHFAVGITCIGLAATGVCLTVRRDCRWIPMAMTVGGIWALMHDFPRIFRDDFPELPLASMLGDKSFERAPANVGDVFFFHRSLDSQSHEYALHGMAIILLLYNLAIVALMWRGGE